MVVDTELKGKPTAEVREEFGKAEPVQRKLKMWSCEIKCERKIFLLERVKVRAAPERGILMDLLFSGSVSLQADPPWGWTFGNEGRDSQ